MAAVLLSGLVLAGSPALAQAPAPNPVATVELAEVIILRVRDPGPWPSVYARAEEIYRRLNEVVQQGPQQVAAQAVAVAPGGGGYVVSVGDRVIATVTRQDARLNGTTPQALARLWAANLRSALASFVALHARPAPPVL